MVTKVKTILIDGEKYTIHRTKPFSVGYGTIGSRGLRVIRTRDDYSMGHFKTLKEFRDDRKYFKKLMKEMMKRKGRKH